MLGDNTDPSEELGDYIFAADAKTFVYGLGYEIADLELGAIYTSTEVKENSETNKYKELTLTAAYGITDSLTAELLYADVDMKDSADDFSKVLASLTYEF